MATDGLEPPISAVISPERYGPEWEAKRKGMCYRALFTGEPPFG
jgi:hypothetical protein